MTCDFCIVISRLSLWILLHFASRRCTVAAMTGQLFIGLLQKDAMSCARDSSKRTQIPHKCLRLNMSNIRVRIYKLDSSMYPSSPSVFINKMSSTSVAQVDDTGKSALDYACEAGQQSTWLLLWQNHQERHSNKALAVPTCCDQ